MRIADRLIEKTPLIILIYYGFHLGLRASHGDIFIKDEAEAIVMAQFPLWGYGPQPPLFSWVLWPIMALFGPTVFSLTLIKCGSLAVTALSTFWAARRLTGSATLAAVAAYGLMLVPQIAWESHRELTHTVLAVALCALSLVQLLRTHDRPSLPRMILLGALVGLAFLAKYNTLFFTAGLFGAALSVPQMRAKLWSVRLLIVPVMALALIAPHAVWMLSHPDPLFESIPKLGMATDHGTLGAAVVGTLGFFNAALQFSILVLLGFGIILWGVDRKTRATAPQSPDWARSFAWRLLGYSMLAALVVVIGSGSTVIKDRWLQPVLYFLPLVFVVVGAHRITPLRARTLVLTSAVFAVLWSAGVGLNHRWDWLNKPSRYAAPFPEVAFQMRVQEIRPGTIIAHGHWIAGNLKRVFPYADVVTERFPHLPVTAREPIVLFWDANEFDEPPTELRILYMKLTGKPLGLMPLRVFSAPWPPGRKEKELEIAAYGWRENLTPPRRY